MSTSEGADEETMLSPITEFEIYSDDLGEVCHKYGQLFAWRDSDGGVFLFSCDAEDDPNALPPLRGAADIDKLN